MEKLEKVKSIINSCKTYEQIRTCTSFASNPSFFPNISDRWKVLGLIYQKMYEMRTEDIKKIWEE